MCTVLKSISTEKLVIILSKNIPLKEKDKSKVILALVPLAKDSSRRTIGSLSVSSGVPKKVLEEFFPLLVEENILSENSSKSVKSKGHYSFKEEFRKILKKEAKRFF